MFQPASLTEKQRDRLIFTFLAAGLAGLGKTIGSGLGGIVTDAIRRGLGWEDDDGDEEDDPDDDVDE